MYKATLSFTTKDYDVRKNQILAEDFTTQDEIDEFLRIGYIVVYEDTLEITQNGLYDVEDYEQANVDVPATQPNLQDKNVTVTQNGETTITADTGYDGLSEVGLNVSVPAPQPSLQDKQVSVTSNTTTTIQADSQYDGLGTVEVTTNVQSLVVMPNAVKFDNSTATDFSFLSRLDFSNYTDFSQMFHNCYYVTGEIDMSNYINSNVTSINAMFQNCYVLESIKLDNSITTGVNSFANMFSKCRKVKRLDLSSFTFAQNQLNNSNFNLNSMFYDCLELEYLDISGLDFSGSVASNTHGSMFANVPTTCTIYVKDQTAVNKLTNWDNTHTYTIKP